MPDAQYWNGYDRILDKIVDDLSKVSLSVQAPGEDIARLYRVVAGIVELLQRTQDMRSAQEASALSHVFMRGMSPDDGKSNPSAQSSDGDLNTDEDLDKLIKQNLRKGYI